MKHTMDQNFIDWYYGVFPLGYGSGEPLIIPKLRQFMSWMKDDEAYDYVKIEADIGPEITWFIISALGKQNNIIEYGTSPRFGWLTKKGKLVRDFILSMTSDQLVELVTNNDVDCYIDACNCGENGYINSTK